MNSICVAKHRVKILAAASAASLALVSSAFAQSNVGAGQVVISSAGSTALKNWFVAKTTTFTDIQPGTSLSIDGVSYPPALDGGVNYWSVNGGPGISYQLAPKANTSSNTGSPTDQTAAIQFVYHESGSVEGILELANDQLYTNSSYAPATGIPSTSIAYVTANIDRNPEGGNAQWVNYNQIGASGVTAGATFNATTGAAPAGTTVTLGNFYGTGVGQTGTPGQSGTAWKPGSASNPTPTFNQAGANQSGGQNAVQFALSDAIPQQVFVNDYANTSNTYTPAGSATPVIATGVANTSFNSNPLDLGYGQGNSALPLGTLTANSRAAYQSPSVLNMPATAQNPRAAQGTTFGVGAWNNATNGGLGNLNSQLTAVTATAFVANPGTGLTQVDRTDADWLETTSRLKNGASFNMTTRDVNSGTRDVSALDSGVDPTYATGKNDAGNGNLPNGVSNTVFDQESIGAAERFSNKTAGGAQLRPTVQNNRMAVGTLSINDAGGNDTQGIANPVRVLSYSDSVNGTAPYVSPNFATISNGTYVIYQNEQVITLRTPGAGYATNTVVTDANGAQVIQGTVQGDDSSGDVVALLNNTANSVATASSASSPVNPADGLLSQGYIIPSLMQVSKNFNGEGLDNSVSGQIATGSIVSQSNLAAAGGSFNAALYATYSASGGFGPSALPDLTTQQPTTGTGSTYGGKGGTFAKSFYNSAGGAAISITNNNVLFGNFNQNGTRDFNAAVKSGLAADRALITADQAVGASVAGSEFTSAGDNNGVAGGTSGILNGTVVSYTDALGVAHTTLTKGDLIVMGDFNGDGHFDGADLVAMAEDASLSDNIGTDRLSAATYQTGVLNKNAAMDYLNTNVGTTGADLYIRQSGRAILEGTGVPAGATAVTNPITLAPVVDPVTGLAEYSYDPSGTNTFNKSDVNQDGVVDMNDAVVVDNANGLDFSNLGDQISATQQAPVSGATIPLNLVLAKQSDGSSVIDSSDVAVVNTQLTGTGTTNWYGYNLQKAGPSTITFARTGGAVNVSAGASFEVSNGAVQVGGSVDPFSGTGATAGKHVAVAVDGTGSLQFTSGGAVGEVAGLTIGGSNVVDLTNNELKIDYAPGTQATADASVRSYLINGYNHGAWNGVGGISSSSAAKPANSNYALGYADGADNVVAGLSSGQIEVKYTLYGDADLDGSVTGNDFTILVGNLGKTVNAWDKGDFDYDGSVTGNDFTKLVGNLGKSSSDPAFVLPSSDMAAVIAFAQANNLMADVPEPASAGLLVIAVTGALARRRRSV